jgi:hypothetical protein
MVSGLSSLDLSTSVVIKGTSSVAIEAKEQAPMMSDIAATTIILPKAFFIVISLILEILVKRFRVVIPIKGYLPLIGF